GSWGRGYRLGHRAVQRLAHQAPMHLELARHPLDRAHPELVLSSDLLEQLHRRLPPLHPLAPTGVPAAGRLRGFRLRGGPFPTINLGQSSVSKTPVAASVLDQVVRAVRRAL